MEPYREGKALAEIIPPDRRRLKAVALVASSMVAGIVLWVLGGWALEMIKTEDVTTAKPPPPIGYAAGRIGPAVLYGPEERVALPPKTRSVVNVWLQGCSDCMPAFAAMATLQNEGGLGANVPVINVAYGEADQTWAQRYGVAKRLVFDPGGANVVKPLGIGTFTTLVVDPDGSIIHRDRPDRAGYALRLLAFFPSAPPVPRPNAGDPFASPLQPLGQDEVQKVVAANSAGLKRRCWERTTRLDANPSASVTVSLAIERDGHVSSASATGDDAAVERCIENETRGWVFPAAPSSTTVTIPFKFVRL